MTVKPVALISTPSGAHWPPAWLRPLLGRPELRSWMGYRVVVNPALPDGAFRVHHPAQGDLEVASDLYEAMRRGDLR